MDYHIINNADFLEDFQKPLFYWAPGDMMAYISYLDLYNDVVKRDYERVLSYQQENNVQIMDDPEKEIVTHAIVDWAHDREVIIQDSEDTAFPFKSHIESAIVNETKLKKAADTVGAILTGIGQESESEKQKEAEQQEISQGFLTQLNTTMKLGLAGLGIWIAYNIYKDFRKR